MAATTGLPTLLDFAIHAAGDDEVGLIEEAILDTPEVSGINPLTKDKVPNVGAARTIAGRMYKTLVRTALPVVDFRNANEGSTNVKATYENRLIETFLLNPRMQAAKMEADSSEDGAAEYFAMESEGVLQGTFVRLGQSFYYGTQATLTDADGNVLGSVKGHEGLLQTYDAVNMEVDAGGTTDDTCSSVWAVKHGPQAVRWVWGGGGQFDFSEIDLRDGEDSDGKKMTVYHRELEAFPGLQIGSTQCQGRIKKLTEDSGKGLTDALLGSLLAKFKIRRRPDAFFMTRRSLEQLRASRTATNATGSEAPTPTDYEGIPLVPTESLFNTEKLAT